MVVQSLIQAPLVYNNDKRKFSSSFRISRNALTSRTHRNLREDSRSVTWRDVTTCPGISGRPILPDYPVLPGPTGKVIFEQNPGSPAISSYL
eukprot:600466-Amorphochlora_amoeboformis.AAC.1